MENIKAFSNRVVENGIFYGLNADSQIKIEPLRIAKRQENVIVLGRIGRLRMENLSNQELVEKLEMIAGQLALAESFKQLRKEKRYEKELLELEAEVLKRMGC